MEMPNEDHYPWILANLGGTNELDLYTKPILYPGENTDSNFVNGFHPKSLLGRVISYQYYNLFKLLFNPSNYQESILIHAIQSLSLDICKILVPYETQDSSKLFALHTVLISGTYEILEYLLNWGFRGGEVNLARSIERGNLSILRLYFLIEEQTISRAIVWLYRAVEYDQVEVAQWLLSRYVYEQNFLERALFVSIQYESFQSAEMLLKRGIRLKSTIHIPSEEMYQLLEDFDSVDTNWIFD